LEKASPNGDNRMKRLLFVISATLLATGSVFATAPSETNGQDALPVTESVGLEDVGAGNLLLKTPQPGRYVPAPTVATDVHMRITGMIARVRVTQRFENPSDEWVEGVYVFPLPEGAAVDRLRMRIGERIIEGRIKERAEAKRIYEKAKQSGKRAALTSQERPNIFTNSVANIGPKDAISVEIEYQESLRYRSGRFSVRFPMVVAPRYIPGKPLRTEVSVARFDGTGWAPDTDQVADASRITPPVLPPSKGSVNPVTMRIDLDAGFPLARLESESHRIDIEDQKDGSASIRFANTSAPADRDFVLSWSPRAGDAPRAALFTEAHEDQTYALFMVLPPDAPAQQAILRREIVFVIDTSGSMGGASIRQAKRALALAIERLRDGDRFNVIEFNSATRLLFDKPRPATLMSKRRALQYVASLDAGGGTEMMPALKAALARGDENRQVRQVVFLTDGSVGNEAALFKVIHENLGATRLFTVGIGSAPNSHFMNKAAQFGRGTFTYIGAVAEVGEKMHGLFSSLESPVMQNLDIRWPEGMKDIEIFPARLPDLYGGDPLIISARLPKTGGHVDIDGRRANEQWHTRLTLEGGREHAGIGALWARKKIASLMGSVTEGADRAAVKKAVLEVALGHHLVSKYTSLVAVDVTPVRPAQAGVTKRAVLTNLPAGWQYEKVFANLPRTATPATLHLLAGALFVLVGLLWSTATGSRWPRRA
jgi:Ca-activated chloride channel family protein